ncbi:MAG TPA: hypothetical protein VGC45_00765 [Gryllotalpicola sp.]
MNTNPSPSPSSSPSGAALSWQLAKSTTQATEKKIAGQLDADLVAAVKQQEKGTLLPCDSTAPWQWAGGTTVTFTRPTEPKPILEELQKKWSAEPGFTASLITDSVDGSPELSLHRNPVEGYVIAPTKGDAGLEISSFSQCFTLPEDEDPGRSF